MVFFYIDIMSTVMRKSLLGTRAVLDFENPCSRPKNLRLGYFLSRMRARTKTRTPDDEKVGYQSLKVPDVPWSPARDDGQPFE